MDIEKIVKSAQKKARTSHGKDLSEANTWQLHDALSWSVMEAIGQSWMKHSGEKDRGRKAAYLSAEFLVGRAVQNNLLNLGVTEKLQNELS